MCRGKKPRLGKVMADSSVQKPADDDSVVQSVNPQPGFTPSSNSTAYPQQRVLRESGRTRIRELLKTQSENGIDLSHLADHMSQKMQKVEPKKNTGISGIFQSLGRMF